MIGRIEAFVTGGAVADLEIEDVELVRLTS
jgi:hypothetical protein